MNKKKSPQKLEDGKEEDGEKNTKELDDIKCLVFSIYFIYLSFPWIDDFYSTFTN